ncbi:MAG: flagellin, partial [Terracidiphilus sp.]
VTTAAASTVDTLIAAINGSGRGLTATFTTGTAAGDATAGAHTGIMISGNINSTSAATVGGLQKITIASGTNDTTDVGAGSTLADDATGGVASISYTASAGTNLSGTDLTNAGNAQTALTSLNAAISNVSAQDGYIGAQINQLNAASSVLSTQAENVQSAQNAVQATDYASATSNMSKYEILSQTGISALAQANSMQQEVTKLLQ